MKKGMEIAKGYEMKIGNGHRKRILKKGEWKRRLEMETGYG